MIIAISKNKEAFQLTFRMSVPQSAQFEKKDGIMKGFLFLFYIFVRGDVSVSVFETAIKRGYGSSADFSWACEIVVVSIDFARAVLIVGVLNLRACFWGSLESWQGSSWRFLRMSCWSKVWS